jgi:NAD(P)-dependent dehydrogenase (short-subunit alcohol dehydrogenase family)
VVFVAPASPSFFAALSIHKNLPAGRRLYENILSVKGGIILVLLWKGASQMLCCPIAGEGSMLLAEKVAVITGGGRGIGRAIALRFAGEGAAVVLAARTVSEIEAVAGEVRDAGGRAAAVPADVADENNCERLIREAESQFGKVDILVNNAGEYGPVKPIEEITPGEWDRVIAVHLRGAYLLTRLVLPRMYVRGSGAILNISSLSAKSAFGWGSPYASAKAGMLGMTRVVAAEAARKGVRVNAICPGPVTETKMSKDLGQTLATRLGVSKEDQLKGFLNTILQGRGQTANEIAAAALFLCSDEASAITGQSLNVDGGAAFC